MFPVSIVNTIYRFRCVSVEGSSIKNWWWEQEVPQKKKNKLQFDVSCHHSHDTIFFFSSSHWSAWVFEDHSVVLNHNTSRGNQTMGGKGEGNFKKREGVNADLERSKRFVFCCFFYFFFFLWRRLKNSPLLYDFEIVFMMNITRSHDPITILTLHSWLEQLQSIMQINTLWIRF